MSNQADSKARKGLKSSSNSNQMIVGRVNSESVPSRPSLLESPDFKADHTHSADEEDQVPLHLTTIGTEDSLIDQHQNSTISLQRRSSLSQPIRTQSIQNGQYIRDISFPGYTQPSNADIEAQFGMFTFSDNQEINELLKTLELRFMKLEKRLEASENLTHLQDEAQRQIQLEKRNIKAQSENITRGISAKLSSLEKKMEKLEESLRIEKQNTDHRVKEFTRKIEQYLGKFILITTNLAQKFDSLALTKDKENVKPNEKFSGVESKIIKIAEEIKERLKVLYDMVEDVGKLAQKSAEMLDEERYGVRKLEDDFLRLLNTSKELSQSTGDSKRVSNEIRLLKSQQMAILNFLNFGVPSETLDDLEIPFSVKKHK